MAWKWSCTTLVRGFVRGKDGWLGLLYADGSVDLFFGPTAAPEGKERNWVRTNPEKGFFVVFRFYGPLEGYIEKTWVLDDFERLH